jgi:hypothetical protein
MRLALRVVRAWSGSQLRNFSELAKNYPASTGIGCTVIKTALADLLAQKVGAACLQECFRTHLLAGVLFTAACSLDAFACCCLLKGCG